MMRGSFCNSANMVGQRIKEIRKDKGMSQGALAAKVQLLGSEISQSKLSRIERQRIAIIDFDLYVITLALDIDVGDLFPARHTKNGDSDISTCVKKQS